MRNPSGTIRATRMQLAVAVAAAPGVCLCMDEAVHRLGRTRPRMRVRREARRGLVCTVLSGPAERHSGRFREVSENIGQTKGTSIRTHAGGVLHTVASHCACPGTLLKGHRCPFKGQGSVQPRKRRQQQQQEFKEKKERPHEIYSMVGPMSAVGTRACARRHVTVCTDAVWRARPPGASVRPLSA